MADPATEMGVRWSQEALEILVTEAQGFPNLLQVLAHPTWEAVQPYEHAVLDDAAVRAGLPMATDQLNTMYSARWGAATELEKQIMAVMAAAGTPTVTRAVIAETLSRPQALGVPRDRLIDKGINEPAGHGELRFNDARLRPLHPRHNRLRRRRTRRRQPATRHPWYPTTARAGRQHVVECLEAQGRSPQVILKIRPLGVVPVDFVV